MPGSVKRRVVSGLEQDSGHTTPVSPNLDIMLLGERSFDNMDEPSACVKLRSELMGRFCKSLNVRLKKLPP